MSDFKKIQNSFVNGEISPRLKGRSDLASYDKSVVKMENAYPFIHGGCTRRPGTRFITNAQNATKEIRMIPYIFSRTASFALVFNNGFIRFIKNGVQLGGAYQISHPFSDSELHEVTYAQVGNLMFLNHKNHFPLELLRITDTNWLLQNRTFVYDSLVDTSYQSAYLNFKIVSDGTGTLFQVGDGWDLVTDGNGNVSGTPVFTGPTLPTPPPGALTAVVIHAATDVIQLWRIECVEAVNGRQTFTVTGSISGVPPVEWSPGNYPNAVALHNQRLWYGGSDLKPGGVWGSGTGGDFRDFTVGPEASDAIIFEAASNTFDEIRHLVSSSTLLAFSTSNEFSIAEGEGGITSTSVQTTTSHGINDVQPIKIGEDTVFVQRDGKKVRASVYDLNTTSQTAPDITLLSEHISGTATGFIDMTFQQDPDYLMWFIRDDGQLISLSYLKEQEVIGWARQVTLGEFKAVVAIPEGSTDVVYIAATRDINGADVLVLEVMDPTYYTDSGEKQTTGTPKKIWTGFNHLEGELVDIRYDGKIHAPQVVSGGSITLIENASEVEVGLPFDTTITLLHPEVAMSDGTSQGSPLAIRELVVRLQDTVGLTVDDGVAPVEQFSIIFNQTPAPFTGDKFFQLHGWSSPNELSIIQNNPSPFTMLATILKVTVGDK